DLVDPTRAALFPRVAQEGERRLEGGLVQVDVVAEHVRLAMSLWQVGVDLDARDHEHIHCGARRLRLGDAVGGVVVGEADQRQSGVGGLLDKLSRREQAIGGGRVGVQVNAGGPRRACAHLAYSTARVSRTTETLIWPG